MAAASRTHVAALAGRAPNMLGDSSGEDKFVGLYYGIFVGVPALIVGGIGATIGGITGAGALKGGLIGAGVGAGLGFLATEAVSSSADAEDQRITAQRVADCAAGNLPPEACPGLPMPAGSGQ